MYPPSEWALREAAIRTSHHSFTADDIGVANQAVRHQFRMLHHVGHVADDAGNQDAILRHFDVLPHFPFVLMAHVCGFKLIAAHAQLEKQIDDVPQRDVEDVRRVPATPTDVISNSVLRKTFQRMN
jgi:hypothetical protein